MKKVSLILILFMLTLLPCGAKENILQNQKSSNVFVYHIPDDEKDSAKSPQKNTKPEVKQEDTVSDDVTADTSSDSKQEDEDSEEELSEGEGNDENYTSDYGIDDMYSDVLKGYASYNEGEEDEVSLDDTNDALSINIKHPAKVAAANYTQLKTTPLKFYNNNYSKFNTPELSIAPLGSSNYSDIGAWQFGTTYDQYIDTGELEQTSGIYSQYKYKNLSLKTSYTKTINSTNNNYNDKLYFSPSYKLNQYMTLSPVFSADLTKQTKKAEFVISLNPLGNKDDDRVRLDLGISQQYSELTDTFRNQFRFSTNFKF